MNRYNKQYVVSCIIYLAAASNQGRVDCLWMCQLSYWICKMYILKPIPTELNAKKVIYKIYYLYMLLKTMNMMPQMSCWNLTLHRLYTKMNLNTRKNKLVPFWTDWHLEHVTCTSHPIGRLLVGSDDVIIMTLVAMFPHYHGLNSLWAVCWSSSQR